MPDINHLFHIDAPEEKVYQAITTLEGLQNWWTSQASGSTEKKGILRFEFNDLWYTEMRIINLLPEKKVEWKCTDEKGAEWLDTHIVFLLDNNDAKTRVRFYHQYWRESTDLYALCNFSWGRYMESLRNYCETGKGNPFTGPDSFLQK